MVTSPASCFLSPLSSSIRRSSPFIIPSSNTQQNRKQLHSTNNKDDEIAALEAKLAQLKQEKELEVAPTTSAKNEVVGNDGVMTEEEDDGDIRIKIPEKNLKNERSIASNTKNLVPLDEMLSENWKESDLGQNGGGNGGIVSSLLTIIAVVVGFVLLGQIPVGQEGLDKYSTAKPSTTIDLGDKNPISTGLDIH